MAAVRMSPKQARRLAFTRESEPEKKVQKPARSAQVTRRIEEPAVPVSVAVGENWRVEKGLQPVFGSNVPLIGTVCEVWLVGIRRVYLLGDGYSMDVSRTQLAAFFVREEGEEGE